MGNFIKHLFDKKMPKQKSKILMLGLDGAGKTTTLYSLKLGEAINTIPTIGFNVEQLNYKTISFLVWDVGGQEKLRNLWSHYFQKCRGLIFVVDSSDQQRIDIASKQLNKIVEHPQMQDCVVLVLANKRDVATMSVQQISTKLQLQKLKRNWAVYPVCAIKEQGNNLDKAMQWLIHNINDIKNPKKIIDMGKIRSQSTNENIMKMNKNNNQDNKGIQPIRNTNINNNNNNNKNNY